MHVLGLARTDNRVMREATALAEAGFAVTIVDVVDSPPPSVEEEISGISVEHIIMHSLSVPTRFKPWFLVKSLRLIMRGAFQLMRVQADIYHAHEEMALPACYIAARLRRKPLIFDSHELPFSNGSFLRWSRLRAISMGILRRMISYCAAVITVSSPIQEEIRQRYHASRVMLIRNVPSYQAFLESKRLRSHLGLSPKTRIALYQGNLSLERGLDTLVRAAAFFERDIVMVMMGNGSEETRMQLKALITSEGVADHVKIIPAVPYKELLEWTASADIGLIVYPPDNSPNIRMCLPNKLFEYLMAGLPILASSLDAVADIVSSYDAGQIVHSMAPADIGAAVNALLTDPSALSRMHHNALKAAQDLCWEKESQQLDYLYDDIFSHTQED